MNPRLAVIGIPNAWSTEKLADALAKQTGFRCVINAADLQFDCRSMAVTTSRWDLSDFDGIVVKKIALEYGPHILDRLEILRIVEGRGVRVFSPVDSIAPLIDRLSGTIRLRTTGVAMPETLVTECMDKAEERVKEWGKAVAKPLYSSKARGMVVLESGNQLQTSLRQFQSQGNQLMYLQKWVDSPGYDLGVAFVGGQYLGTYARVQKGRSWSTSTAQGGKYAPREISPELIELAHRAQSPFNLDFTCVDIVESSEGPLVYEVSAFGGFRGLLNACGIDAAERYATYVVQELKKRD